MLVHREKLFLREIVTEVFPLRPIINREEGVIEELRCRSTLSWVILQAVIQEINAIGANVCLCIALVEQILTSFDLLQDLLPIGTAKGETRNAFAHQQLIESHTERPNIRFEVIGLALMMPLFLGAIEGLCSVLPLLLCG